MIFPICKNLERSFFHVVKNHAFARQTDGQTDMFLIARLRLHCMQQQRGNKTRGILMKFGSISFMNKFAGKLRKSFLVSPE